MVVDRVSPIPENECIDEGFSRLGLISVDWKGFEVVVFCRGGEFGITPLVCWISPRGEAAVAGVRDVSDGAGAGVGSFKGA